MPAPSDLVHETATTTGTGNFTLSNVNGKRSFNTAFGTGGTDLFDYFISNRDAAEWERGTGHLSAASTLVRDTVIASSNSNNAVNFSAGTKDVTNDVPAANQARLDTGLHNGKITESQSSNAATFSLKTIGGSDPSAAEPVLAVLPDGSKLLITAALSITIPSTATMEFQNATVGRIWVGLVSDSGTARLAVRNCKGSASIVGFPATGLLSSTAISTSSDTAQVTYTDSAVTDKPYILCAYAQWDSGLTTAGTWDASPTRIVQYGPHVPRPGTQVGNYKTAVNSGEVSASNSTPVQTNSTVSITPTDKANAIKVRVFGTIRTTNPNVIGAAQISRGTSPTLIGNVANMFGSASSALDAVYGPGSMAAFDYPATTSAQAYYVYIWEQAGSVASGTTWLPNAASSNSFMEADEIMS